MTHVGKPVVVRSVNDATGTRCVDVRREGQDFSWVACRRDPEDGHGWRVILGPVAGFATEEGAFAAAVEDVGWLAAR